ncbi:MAG TPA: P27 family phage terminase small subunit [Candidatus Binatia bacterium]|nr:P27 family phage terminase small subunit [Candidatus Binatia bacterium]
MPKTSISAGKNQRFAAPKHLKPATREWYERICSEYELEPHHLKILQIAAEAWDTYERARDVISKHGMTFVNEKFGDVKPRPEVAIMQNSRLAFLRALRELNLDVEPPETPRPSPLKYR